MDVHIPGVDVVGGYSMTSPPHQLDDPSIKTIELAVKHSPHPPTEWMTTNVSVLGRPSRETPETVNA